MRRVVSIATLFTLAAACEAYEFPPRLVGVGTDDCPDCELLVLSESRLPPGDVAISGRFAFEDDQATLTGLTVYVTTPSGEVVQQRCGEREVERSCGDGEEAVDGRCFDIEPVFCDGFACTFATDESEALSPTLCELTAERSNGGTENSVGARLRGYSQGVLAATFGLRLDQIGEWSVEVEAVRADGAESNRLSATFDVAEDVVDDDSDADE